MSLVIMYLQITKKITMSHLIGSEGFWSDSREFSEMWTLYVKNIIFAYSLPMSTSTWYSNYLNRPSRYMSRELQLENINKKRAPTWQSYHLVNITQLFYWI
jgi:hypothetical protein